jgi:FtsP/CotA-like multicopper oxidase with cupredoxin domain
LAKCYATAFRKAELTPILTDKKAAGGMHISRVLLRFELAALLLAASHLASRAEAVEVRRFEFGVTDGKLTAGERTVRVTRGETVELAWRSNAPAVIHLHGYDLEAAPTPGAPQLMRFVARATGRFPVESHGSSGGHTTLIYVEVYPPR